MHKPIRILSIGHSYVVAMNRAILRELAYDPDFAVTVGAPQVFHGSLRSIHMEPEPEDSPLKVVPLPAYLTQKMHVFFYGPGPLNRLINQGFDGAHFWEEPYILAGYQLCRQAQKSKVPYLFRTAQSLIKDYVFPFKYFEKQSLSQAKQFIAGGHLVYQAMRDKGWELPGEVLTLAVDTGAFKPMDENQKQQKRTELGLKGPVIGYLGRLSEEKGCDIFMEALGKLKHKSWSFLIMGSGPYQEKITEWVKREGLSERVQIQLLTHDQVPNVLPVVDLLICPSQTRPFWKEQFGRMLVEAFAAGVPVIGSDSGEIPRVIGEAGRILPEADTEAWTVAIDEYLDDPQGFNKYREQGLLRASHYSANTMAEKYKEVYRRLAGQQ